MHETLRTWEKTTGTLQLNAALIRKLRESLMCLAYFVLMLFIGCSLQPGTGKNWVDCCRS